MAKLLATHHGRECDRRGKYAASGFAQVERKKSGRVIITSSTFGRQGNGLKPTYVTSKWGMVGLTVVDVAANARYTA
ncbi:SDR family NAD(P)-dependent oxidoreductase [cf. Phormidesmis sp. LEGE 11477]|uniref:SDR family NAD(P)-dependent oxidoreductase n=1 Tax=cf. Phormidesmis sp. LEGE 11477 TaxID=1828680 RepID=UPI00187E0320|nr:SDR family NAD(P)-dependent oxidoreductase [cf. Phormidesmis sp. LEGE 11477]MBE9063937.1 SDR family NAD(P)-dependent oxidoreductase [cf. Phormidesmis sp. LEGE 11477]